MKGVCTFKHFWNIFFIFVFHIIAQFRIIHKIRKKLWPLHKCTTFNLVKIEVSNIKRNACQFNWKKKQQHKNSFIILTSKIIVRRKQANWNTTQRIKTNNFDVWQKINFVSDILIQILIFSFHEHFRHFVSYKIS